MYKLQTCKALEMKKPSKLQVQKYLLTPQTNIHFIMKDLKRADTEKALAARVVIAKYCWMSRKVDDHDRQDLWLSLPFPERKGGFDHLCFYSSVRAKTQIKFWANFWVLQLEHANCFSREPKWFWSEKVGDGKGGRNHRWNLKNSSSTSQLKCST